MKRQQDIIYAYAMTEWDISNIQMQIVKFSCPADLNITKKVVERKNNYIPLILSMQIMYPNWKFEMLSRCFWLPLLRTKTYMKQLGFDDNEIPFLVRRLQFATISCTVNICKEFFNFNDAK